MRVIRFRQRQGAVEFSYMPIESFESSPTKKENPLEQAENLEKLREEIFESLEATLRDESFDVAYQVARRIFDHSTEDGLLAFEKIHATPGTLQIASLFRMDWILKHKALAEALVQKMRKEQNHLSLTSEQQRGLEIIENLLDQMKRDKKFFFNEDKASFEKTLEDKEKSSFNEHPLAKKIDAYYAHFLKNRSIEAVKEEVEGTKGVRLAERHLAKVYDALQGSFYQGPVLDFLGKLEADKKTEKEKQNIREAKERIEKMRGPLLWESDLKTIFSLAHIEVGWC